MKKILIMVGATILAGVLWLAVNPVEILTPPPPPPAFAAEMNFTEPTAIVADNPNFSLIYKDELIAVYEDAEFGARIVLNLTTGGVAAYCPCKTSRCAEDPLPELAFPTPTQKRGDDGEPTPTQPPEPTPTSPPPTIQPSPTPTPDKKEGCNNGVGNGPDCPPPGHDKDGDGVADDPKGDNDDDHGNRPCGDPGNPCNNGGNGKGNKDKGK